MAVQVHDTASHDDHNEMPATLQHADIGQRIALQQDEISQPTCLQDSHLVFQANDG